MLYSGKLMTEKNYTQHIHTIMPRIRIYVCFIVAFYQPKSAHIFQGYINTNWDFHAIMRFLQHQSINPGD